MGTAKRSMKEVSREMIKAMRAERKQEWEVLSKDTLRPESRGDNVIRLGDVYESAARGSWEVSLG